MEHDEANGFPRHVMKGALLGMLSNQNMGGLISHLVHQLVYDLGQAADPRQALGEGADGGRSTLPIIRSSGKFWRVSLFVQLVCLQGFTMQQSSIHLRSSTHMIPSDNPKMTVMTAHQNPTTSKGIKTTQAKITIAPTIIHMISSMCHLHFNALKSRDVRAVGLFLWLFHLTFSLKRKGEAKSDVEHPVTTLLPTALSQYWETPSVGFHVNQKAAAHGIVLRKSMKTD